MTPARARSRAHLRTESTPRAPRRVSGPLKRRVVAAPVPAAASGVPRRGLSFGRVRALPEHRVVDRLLRSRLWIWALGALLGGIVAMQVSLLKLNSGIQRAVTTTTTVERQNAALEAAITGLSRTDRIQTGAQALGMLMPPAGEVAYLSAGPQDASRALRRMQPPSTEAAALLANHGIVPASLAAPAVAEATPAAATVDPAAATVAPTVDPAAATVAPTVDPAAATVAPTVDQAAATAAPTAPPVATPAPPVATPAPAAAQPPPTTTSQTSVTGGAGAGQG